MSSPDKRKALGRGLSALIPGAQPEHVSAAQAMLRREFFECAIEELYPSDDNPRQIFDDARLGELAESIQQPGDRAAHRRADAPDPAGRLLHHRR